jgi:phosphoribosyl-ATP pyrophosphohydrolase/phosphoribosyl-AMP cyclohydrolase/histidinol dehydrogenase
VYLFASFFLHRYVPPTTEEAVAIIAEDSSSLMPLLSLSPYNLPPSSSASSATFPPVPPTTDLPEDILTYYSSLLVTDRPDGLFSTVVSDDCNVCLGLVYSSKERLESASGFSDLFFHLSHLVHVLSLLMYSLRFAFYERRGIYYSRSRKEIWRKGLSSGNIQVH